MKVINFSEGRREECANFWWHLYEDLPYVHLPDGYQNVNSHTHIPPEYFLDRLDWGLRCDTLRRWHGEVRDDTIFLAIENESVVGMAVCSVSREESKGSILAAYMQCDLQGRQAAAALVDSALQFFQKAGLKQAVAGPDVTKSLEAERPTHLALLDAGFRWTGELVPSVITDEESEPYVDPEYGTFLGGSLVGFKVSEEIEQKIDMLEKAGISIEKFTSDRFDYLYGIVHPYLSNRTITGDTTFVAVLDGCPIAWLEELQTYGGEDEYDTPRIKGECVPRTVPEFRGKGISKVLYHVGMDEIVKRGAECGWTATGVTNPARSIYQSIGYSNWYLGFNRIQKYLTH